MLMDVARAHCGGRAGPAIHPDWIGTARFPLPPHLEQAAGNTQHVKVGMEV